MVVPTCIGSLVSTCTGLGTRGDETASVLPGTAAVVLRAFTASRTVALCYEGRGWLVVELRSGQRKRTGWADLSVGRRDDLWLFYEVEGRILLHHVQLFHKL